MTEAADLAAANIGGTLLDALLDEIKLLQDPYQKLPTAAREELVDRLSKRIQSAVALAMRTLVQQEYPAVPAELGNVVFTAKGIKANVLVPRTSERRHELADHAVDGANVLVILADPSEYFESLDAQRKLPLGPPAGVDPETGEVIEEPAPAAESVAAATETAPASTSLVDRLAALDVPIDGDDPFWTDVQPADLSAVMDWVKAKEAGEEVEPPKVLRDRVAAAVVASAAEALAWITDDGYGKDLRELCLALTANGVPVELLTEATVGEWMNEQIQDLWDWIEVAEYEGPIEDKDQETIDAFKRASELLVRDGLIVGAALVPTPSENGEAPTDPVAGDESGDDDLPAGGDVFAPAYVRDELLGVGLDVPETEIEKWSRDQIKECHGYIDEFSKHSGPAIVPEVLEPFLSQSADASDASPDVWSKLADNPQKLGERLVAHKLMVPAGEVYGWSNVQRMEVCSFMRTVLVAAESGEKVPAYVVVPAVLRTYISGSDAAGPLAADAPGATEPEETDETSTGDPELTYEEARKMPMADLRLRAAPHKLKARGQKELIRLMQEAGLVGPKFS